MTTRSLAGVMGSSLDDGEAALYGHDKEDEYIVVAVPDELMGNRRRWPPSAPFVARRRKALKFVARRRKTSSSAPAAGGSPATCVPETLEIMGALPRTPNDKYDRTQLPWQGAALTDC